MDLYVAVAAAVVIAILFTRFFQALAALASFRKRTDEVPRDGSHLQEFSEDDSFVEESRELLQSDRIVNPTWEYHVFLSFRGEDTRLKFCDHLYHALCGAGINTFRDDEELPIGEEIAPALLSAIEKSRISIIVFSKDYASSRWCLDELVKILECRKQKKQVVIPIFYEVEPAEIILQTGITGKAMAKHEKKYKDNIEKVQRWRSALREAESLDGGSYQKWRSALREAESLEGGSYQKLPESELIAMIIQKISSILGHPLLPLPEQAVGLESRKSDVVSLLNIGPNDVDISMVGIHGYGGVGKTTVAKAVYNSVAAHFESTCFCANVQENTTSHGLPHIQQTILTDMLGKNKISLRDTSRGITLMKERLCNKRVLLVLDNVDDKLQLQSLADGCDWFGAGSRVIITTRNKQLLCNHGIEKIYEVEELNREEALELFCWRAFRSNQPKSGFEDVSNRVLRYANGIPLTLKNIGSELRGKEVDIWESAIKKYQKSMDMQILSIPKVSFERLEFNEREIFLDVACFFKGYRWNYVEEILEGCRFSSKYGLSVLEDWCLVKRQHGLLWMHDLIESMGKEIVRLKSPKEHGNRSRIWFHQDALRVLTGDTGTSKVGGLMLEIPQRKEVVWNGKAFKNMSNLRILIIRNVVFSKAPNELPNSLVVFEWDDYPSSSLPSNFCGNNLVKFSLRSAPQIMQLHETFEKFQNITPLFIRHCEGLKEVPEFSSFPSRTNLVFGSCRSLVKIQESVEFFDQLKVLTTTIDSSELLGNLQTFLFYEVRIDFLRDGECRLIQELMDHHYSVLYCASGARVPRCFRYRSNTNFISFWIREIVPDLHVSFAAIATGPMHPNRFTISLCIRLMKITVETRIIAHRQRASTKILWLHPFLSSNEKDYPEVCELLRSDEWVRVDLRVVTIPYTSSPASTNRNQASDAFVTGCGVYVSPACDANFSFVDPNRRYPTAGQDGALMISSTDSDQLLKKTMCLNVPPQVKRFVWAAISDYLPRSISLHVMKQWEWARQVWLVSPLGLRVDRMEADDSCEWMLEMVSILDIESLELFVVIAWELWSEWDIHCMGYETQEDPTSLVHRMRMLLEDYRISSQDIETDGEIPTNDRQPTRQDGDHHLSYKKEGTCVKCMEKGIFQASLASFRTRSRDDDDTSLLQEESSEDQSSVRGGHELQHGDTFVSLDNPVSKKYYDVFVSFRGEETGFKFSGHLYKALHQAGITAFRDKQDFQVGDEIAPARYSVIEQSRIAIIVFSSDYASSTRCLDELVKILECKKEKKQVVLPIFYEVDPAEIKKQTGNSGLAMARHEKKYKANIEKVQKWRSALCKAANLKGESYKQEIKVYIHEHAVGLESRKSIVTSLLNNGPEVVNGCMVGICGTGGVGKTTIAKAVYNSIAAQFESTCFYVDVRENTTKHELVHIQRTILSDLLGKNDMNLSNTHRGIELMKELLCNKRVLLVLDDVDDESQLQSLAGRCDWFGAGSRVIITTRNKQLLCNHGIEKIYEVEELNGEEALELLCLKAFRSNRPKSGFEDVSNRVLRYAKGIPLALEIIGSHLYGKEVEMWESAMDKYNKSMDKNIFGILKVSFESLDSDEQDIFLDVACYLKGVTYDHAAEILEGRDFGSKFGLSILEDRYLVQRQGANLWMHDLVQSMGREIVHQESEMEPGERSRIWSHEDALQVITRDTGTSKVYVMMLEFPRRKMVQWNGEAFKKMVNLQILIIRNALFSEAPKELPDTLRVIEWENYPSSSLPSNFNGSELQELHLTNGAQTVQLQQPFKKFQNLTSLAIEFCDGLKEVPDVFGLTNLTSLSLRHCRNLVKVDDLVGSHDKLTEILLDHCSELEEFPAWNRFASLLVLCISGCNKLEIIPSGGRQTSLKLFVFYDGVINFQSDSKNRLIQELMDCHFSEWYYIFGARVPTCFRYRSKGNSISFWVRKPFPDLHFEFATNGTGIDRYGHRFGFSLRIGHTRVKLDSFWMRTESSSINICWIFNYLSREDCLKVQELLHESEDWVRVVIRVDPDPDDTQQESTTSDYTSESDAIVRECGLYVSSTCEANFSFEDPTDPDPDNFRGR